MFVMCLYPAILVIVLVILWSTSDIDLKEAQRFFAQKFSCGASVTAEDEIIIQGDFTDDIIDVIQEKWPEVSKHPRSQRSLRPDEPLSKLFLTSSLTRQVDDDSIDDLGEVKK